MKPIYFGLIVLVLALAYLVYKSVKEGFVTSSEKLGFALSGGSTWGINDSYTSRVFGRILRDVLIKFKKGPISDISNNLLKINNIMTDASGVLKYTNPNSRTININNVSVENTDYTITHKLLLGRLYLDLSGSTDDICGNKRRALAASHISRFGIDISNSLFTGLPAEAAVEDAFGVQTDAIDVQFFTQRAPGSIIDPCIDPDYYASRNAFISKYVADISNTTIRGVFVGAGQLSKCPEMALEIHMMMMIMQ
jgi:hypothetical protein